MVIMYYSSVNTYRYGFIKKYMEKVHINIIIVPFYSCLVTIYIAMLNSNDLERVYGKRIKYLNKPNSFSRYANKILNTCAVIYQYKLYVYNRKKMYHIISTYSQSKLEKMCQKGGQHACSKWLIDRTRHRKRTGAPFTNMV